MVYFDARTTLDSRLDNNKLRLRSLLISATLATVAIDKGMPIEQLQKLHQRILQYAMVKQ